MLAKTWKQIGLIILLICCIVNIVRKTVTKVSFVEQVKTTTEYIQNNQ